MSRANVPPKRYLSPTPPILSASVPLEPYLSPSPPISSASVPLEPYLSPSPPISSASVPLKRYLSPHNGYLVPLVPTLHAVGHPSPHSGYLVFFVPALHAVGHLSPHSGYLVSFVPTLHAVGHTSPPPPVLWETGVPQVPPNPRRVSIQVIPAQTREHAESDIPRTPSANTRRDEKHPRLLLLRRSRAHRADILASTHSPSRARLALHPGKDAPRRTSSSPAGTAAYAMAQQADPRTLPYPQRPDSTRLEHPARSHTLPTRVLHASTPPPTNTIPGVHCTRPTHRTSRLRADSHTSNTPLAHPTQHLDQRGPKGRSTPHLAPSSLHHPRPVLHHPQSAVKPLKSTSPHTSPPPRRARTLPVARTTRRTCTRLVDARPVRTHLPHPDTTRRPPEKTPPKPHLTQVVPQRGAEGRSAAYTTPPWRYARHAPSPPSPSKTPQTTPTYLT
ncbi:hypothetical protein C8F04DRAFT_1303495 [Mycena alexandri]|uniref:Uncharacterized protein n=1 Tax=Mycena alexandri TaxID=1745969 RepID=A0AAD6SC25_9AGAR|nr:hypothetical protein C8F04DRAFT_1303495 [Mycena alexandri]